MVWILHQVRPTELIHEYEEQHMRNIISKYSYIFVEWLPQTSLPLRMQSLSEMVFKTAFQALQHTAYTSRSKQNWTKIRWSESQAWLYLMLPAFSTVAEKCQTTWDRCWSCTTAGGGGWIIYKLFPFHLLRSISLSLARALALAFSLRPSCEPLRWGNGGAIPSA